MMTPVNAGDLILTISIGTILIALLPWVGELMNQGGSLASHSAGWVLSNQKEKKDLFIELLNPYIHQKTIEETKNEEGEAHE